MMRRSLLFATPFLLLLLVPRAASGQEIAIARAKAATTFVSELEALASWCDEGKLLRFRDQCYRALLVVEPDHEAARAALRYRRDDSGEWKQGRYREPGNYDAELEPEFPPKFKAAVDRFTETLLAAIESVDEKSEPRSRKRAIEDILTVDPDNLRARRLGGEDRLNGKWVLIETALAKKRAGELRALAKEIKDSIPDPKKIEPTAEEKTWGVDWRAGFQGQRWRGLGTMGEAEVKKAVKTLDAAAPLFAKVFGVGSAGPGGGKGFYLLRSAKEAEAVLKRHPGYDEARRKYLLQLKAAWIPGRDAFFQWNDSTLIRLDGATRNALSLSIMRALGITTKQGWAFEGIGLFFDNLLTGSRRTIYVSQEIYTTTEKAKKLDIERRMKKSGADWLQLAREMLDAAVQPDLRTLVRLDVNEMNAEDLIYGYALVSYLIEGKPEQATHFFTLQGVHRTLPEIISTVFDMTYPDFQARFERWLREITEN